VNTVSSAAYLVAAGWVLQRRPPRWKLWAAVLAAVGLGSIGYHGPGTRAGKALHDGALLAIVPVAASGLRRPNRRLHLAAAIVTTSALLHTVTRTGSPACRPDSRLQGHGLWHVSSAIALALWADGEAAR
jgi:hypothetical protein